MALENALAQMKESAKIKTVQPGSPAAYRRERPTMISGGGKWCDGDGMVSIASLPIGGRIERVSCTVYPATIAGQFELQIINPGGVDNAIKLTVRTGIAAQSVAIDCGVNSSIFAFFTPDPNRDGVILKDVHVGWGCAYRPSSQVVNLEETYIWNES